MALQTVRGVLASTVTSTGRLSKTLSDVPSKVDFYLTINGTASVDVEVSDDGTNFIAVQSGVTATALISVYEHASVIAINVQSVAGGSSVTCTFRAFITGDIVNSDINIFQNGDVNARKITIDAGTITVVSGTYTRLYGPAQPGTSNGTLLTAAGGTNVIDNIHITNTTGTAATITLAINGTAATAANQFLSAFSIPANSTYDYDGPMVLANGDTLQGLQGTSGALTVTASGRII